MCDRIVRSLSAKAERNKRRARASVLGLTASTAAIPVLIVASTRWFSFELGKLAPAILAGLSAVLAGWVQIERPHERWKLYKRYERRIETERLRYKHHVGDYEHEDADLRFIEFLAGQQDVLHDEWSGLIPDRGEVASLGRTSHS